MTIETGVTLIAICDVVTVFIIVMRDVFFRLDVKQWNRNVDDFSDRYAHAIADVITAKSAFEMAVEWIEKRKRDE